MRIEPGKLWTVVEERRAAAGILAERPLRKAAVIAVLKNPFAGIYQADLSPIVEASAHLGELMAPPLLKSLDDAVQSYGKGGLVGLSSLADASFRELDFAGPETRARKCPLMTEHL